MVSSSIDIVSFAYFDHSFTKRIADSVALEFNADVQLKEGHLDISDYYDAPRKQYKGNELLKSVEKSFSDETHKTIGLFNVDLFIPILTYIFGQAYLGGNTAIASAFRLSNARYGMKEDFELLLERMTKEVIHELGHTYGLIHCYTPGCVMASSTYVEDIDQKSTSFCSKCRGSVTQ
ncbi:MAG: archaemetzincin family Zn-dependent metalloprotease [Bacteroidales bacterium]|nr:archaemetzincin family Zn-dependent metalloprotease [Bacteroidales bacterium]